MSDAEVGVQTASDRIQVAAGKPEQSGRGSHTPISAVGDQQQSPELDSTKSEPPR